MTTIRGTIPWSGDPGLYKINKLGAFVHHSLLLDPFWKPSLPWSAASCTIPRFLILWSLICELLALFRKWLKSTKVFWNLGKREGLNTGISVRINFTVSLREEADVELLLFLESCHSRFLHHTYSFRRHQRWEFQPLHKAKYLEFRKALQRWPEVDLRQ